MQPSTHIRAVMWDLGGVIIRTDDPTPRTTLAERFGLSVQALERLVLSGGSGASVSHSRSNPYEQWDKVAQMYDLSPEEVSEARRQFWAGEQVDSSLMVFIRGLRPYCRMAVISNALADLRQTIVSRWQIADSFDEIIISGEVGVQKPDARIFRLTLNRLGILPRQAIFVDNDPENVAAARALGIHAVQFEEPSQAIGEVLEHLEARTPAALLPC